jgi:hypothetical protein
MITDFTNIVKVTLINLNIVHQSHPFPLVDCLPLVALFLIFVSFNSSTFFMVIFNCFSSLPTTAAYA